MRVGTPCCASRGASFSTQCVRGIRGGASRSEPNRALQREAGVFEMLVRTKFLNRGCMEMPRSLWSVAESNILLSICS